MARSVAVCVLLLLVVHCYGYDYSVEPGQWQYCTSLPGTMCGSNGATVLAADNTDPEMLLHLDFESEESLDISGHNNHPKNSVPIGPGRNGRGHSASFDGQNSLELPIPGLDVNHFTISFWIYRVGGPSGMWEPLLRRGSNDKNLTPALMFWPQYPRLHARVTTTEHWNEGLDSHGLIPKGKWTHITLTLDGLLMRLHINGVLDSEKILKGNPLHNTGNLFLGNAPGYTGFNGFIDDVKVFRRALVDAEIQGQTDFLLGGMSGHYIKLGCYGSECKYNKALETCTDGYHMCTSRELKNGAMLVARANGWLGKHTGNRVWAQDCDVLEQKNGGVKTGLCCLDYDTKPSIHVTKDPSTTKKVAVEAEASVEPEQIVAHVEQQPSVTNSTMTVPVPVVKDAQQEVTLDVLKQQQQEKLA